MFATISIDIEIIVEKYNGTAAVGNNNMYLLEYLNISFKHFEQYLIAHCTQAK